MAPSSSQRCEALMSNYPIEPGRVVVSRAGRDKGIAFVVLEKLDSFCLVANGTSRSVLRPKRKNNLHLVPQPDKIPPEGQQVPSDKRATDAYLRKELSRLGYNRKAAFDNKEEG
jgi:ribosomal protein L14E/L6E/L27E